MAVVASGLYPKVTSNLCIGLFLINVQQNDQSINNKSGETNIFLLYLLSCQYT